MGYGPQTGEALQGVPRPVGIQAREAPLARAMADLLGRVNLLEEAIERLGGRLGQLLQDGGTSRGIGPATPREPCSPIVSNIRAFDDRIVNVLGHLAEINEALEI